MRTMSERFSIRPDPSGYSVYDLRSGETVVMAGTRQSGLSRQDAEHTAALLNAQAEPGDRRQTAGASRQGIGPR